MFCDCDVWLFYRLYKSIDQFDGFGKKNLKLDPVIVALNRKLP
jgi:hypothetical protein